MRIGSLNVKVTLDDRDAVQSLSLMMEEWPDVLGLQEWGRDRSILLRQYGPVVMFPRLHQFFKLGQPTSGHVWVYPLGGQPVGYDASVFQLVSVRRIRLARRRRGVRATYGTEVILKGAKGRPLVVLNTHLIAHHDRPANKAAWEEGRAGIEKWSHSWIGYRRVVMGDMNKHLMEVPGLVSCWYGHEADPTFRDRVIDAIYANRTSTDVWVVPNPSDHHGVVVDYGAPE